MNFKGNHKLSNDKYCEYSLDRKAGEFEDKFVTMTERIEYNGNTINKKLKF
jgi:hypothetical protein